MPCRNQYRTGPPPHSCKDPQRKDVYKRQEARLDEVKNMLEECNYDVDEAENIVLEQLGLEMDYLEDILF